MRVVSNELLTGDVPIPEREEQDQHEDEDKKNLELDNSVAQLGISEYQANRLFHFLAGRLDRSNPVAFSKRSSTNAFESGGREYRITIGADTFDTGDMSTTRYFMNALKYKFVHIRGRA